MTDTLFITPSRFTGNDAQRINQAAAIAAEKGLTLVIPRINDQPAPGQPADLWLLDEAIRLPSNITVELHSCHLKLSDRCRDNFFRSANCGPNIDPIEPAANIHLIGKGKVILQGADRPRSTGDSGKTLGKHTYGTDATVADQHPRGDWRNIGILMANVNGFSVQNITLIDSHAWAMSFEFCTQGILRDLHFLSSGKKTIDGQQQTILNQDGLDLRQGCRDILIENITGETGDDLIALTAIPHGGQTAGTFEYTMISSLDEHAKGIHDVTIRNVRGHCAGGHHIVRLLNTKGETMSNILIDGVIDTSRPPFRSRAAVKIGDHNARYGGVNPLGTCKGIVVNNIISKARDAVLIGGSLCDSLITNVLHIGEDGLAVNYQSGMENIRNVQVGHTQQPETSTASA